MIVGGPGSGKSTLARALGALTGLPVFHMDHIHYAPGWVPRDAEVKDWMSREVHRQPRWIFEGGHSRTYADRLARANLLIWLDLPVGLRLWRVWCRTWRYLGKTRPDLPAGCTERLDRGAVDFWLFIWRTRHSSRAKLAEIAAAPPPHLTVVHLRSRREVQAFLGAVEGRGLAGQREPA
ncbi:Adenylate kinase [Vannielia litorea]|uniref:Adenylate kinase n=2 Tax=Vannielia litorea TaxID=1217970 RepID=A0A1N6EG65_9RHOB|nr:Adenylate kinase [Vannielia litorea]